VNLEDYDDEDFLDNYYPVAKPQKPKRGARKKRSKEDPDYTVSCYDTKDLNGDGSSKRTYHFHESSPLSNNSDDKSNSSDEYYNCPVKPKSMKKVFNVITYPHSHGMHTRAHSKTIKTSRISEDNNRSGFTTSDFGHKNGAQIKPCKNSHLEPIKINPEEENRTHKDQEDLSDGYSLFEDAEDDMEVDQTGKPKGKSYQIDNFIIFEECFKSGNGKGFENSSEISSVHGKEEFEVQMPTPVDTSMRDLQAQYLKAFSNRKQEKINKTSGMARNQNERNFISNSKKFEFTHELHDEKIRNNFIPPLPIENVSLNIIRMLLFLSDHSKFSLIV
jgi:hypothetical protein